jgi:hypothetical protein
VKPAVAEHQALPLGLVQMILRERLHMNADPAQHRRGLYVAHPRTQAVGEQRNQMQARRSG